MGHDPETGHIFVLIGSQRACRKTVLKANNSATQNLIVDKQGGRTFKMSEEMQYFYANLKYQPNQIDAEVASTEATKENMTQTILVCYYWLV